MSLQTPTSTGITAPSHTPSINDLSQDIDALFDLVIDLKAENNNLKQQKSKLTLKVAQIESEQQQHMQHMHTASEKVKSIIQQLQEESEEQALPAAVNE